MNGARKKMVAMIAGMAVLADPRARNNQGGRDEHPGFDFVEGVGYVERKRPSLPPPALASGNSTAATPAAAEERKLDEIPFNEFPNETLGRILAAKGLRAVPEAVAREIDVLLADTKITAADFTAVKLLQQVAGKAGKATGKATAGKADKAETAKSGPELVNDPARIEEVTKAIAAAADLEELTELMATEKNLSLLQLADSRAAQIRQAEQDEQKGGGE